MKVFTTIKNSRDSVSYGGDVQKLPDEAFATFTLTTAGLLEVHINKGSDVTLTSEQTKHLTRFLRDLEEAKDFG